MWAFSYSSRLQLLFELTEATVFNLGWLYQSSSINHYRACIVTSLHVSLKPRANGRNIVGCYMLHPFAHPVACCWMLLRVVTQSLKLFSQQLPTFLLFHDRRSVVQQCWIRLHSSSNIVGATHAHYAWFTKTYGLYHSHDALQVPTLLPQQWWELLRPFSSSLRAINNLIDFLCS